MLQRSNRWLASVPGGMLYTLVFIFAYYFWTAAGEQAVLRSAGITAVFIAGHIDGAAPAGPEPCRSRWQERY